MDAERVHDKATFLEFVAAMRNELHAGAEGWASIDLAGFLEAIAAWADDSSCPADPNPWRHTAALMRAGALYE